MKKLDKEQKELIINRFLSQAVVLDTETTGVDTTTAEICEIGTARGALIPAVKNKLFGTKKPIPYGASGKNNITREMLEGIPTIEESPMHVIDVLYLRVSSVKYFVAHNSDYDRNVLTENFKRMGDEEIINALEEKSWICTMRVAKQLFPVSEQHPDISYSLSSLRYMFGLDVGNLSLHRAGDDSMLCWHFLKEISMHALDILEETTELSEDFDLGAHLIDLTSRPVAYTHMPFGKHKGQAITELPEDYIDWLKNKSNALDSTGTDFNEDLYFTIVNEMVRRGMPDKLDKKKKTA